MPHVFVLKSVVAGYDDGDVLRSISLEAQVGERIGLVGPNGAGKTTLLNVLAGLQPPRSGEVVVLDEHLNEGRRTRGKRGRVGLVFQNADDQLFCGTVAEDVAFGPLNLGLDDESVRTRVREKLECVGAAELADRISHHLSAGEKRRVAIAASLSMSPELLLLDEPTGELDPRGRRELIALLQTLEQTLVVATHDLEFVLEACDRVVVINDGKVFAEGEPVDVLADAQMMEASGLEVPYSLRSGGSGSCRVSRIGAPRAAKRSA